MCSLLRNYSLSREMEVMPGCSRWGPIRLRKKTYLLTLIKLTRSHTLLPDHANQKQMHAVKGTTLPIHLPVSTC